MRITSKVALTIFASFCAASPSGAVTKDGRFTILGEGATSCGSWLEQRKDATLWKNESSWVLGYVTAINELVWRGGSNLASNTDPEGLEAWLDNYCTAHPLDTVQTAASVLVSELMQRQAGKKN